MATSMPLAEVKGHLSELVGWVGSQHERVLFTIRGVPSAVLLAPADPELLEERIAILSDREGMQCLHASTPELSAGRGESEADLAAAVELRRRTSTA